MEKEELQNIIYKREDEKAELENKIDFFRDLLERPKGISSSSAKLNPKQVLFKKDDPI